jgi:hypothetical protein
MKFFLHDSDQHMRRQGDPDLGEYGVFGGSIECPDSQVLFEPTEEEFHLPAAVIQFGYMAGIVKLLVRNQTQLVRIIPVCVEVDEHDGLFAAKSSVAIYRVGESRRYCVFCYWLWW